MALLKASSPIESIIAMIIISASVTASLQIMLRAADSYASGADIKTRYEVRRVARQVTLGQIGSGSIETANGSLKLHIYKEELGGGLLHLEISAETFLPLKKEKTYIMITKE